MPLPVVDYLKLPEDGDPYLEGHKCEECGSIFLGEREVCSNCTTRGKIKAVKLNNKGILRNGNIFLLVNLSINKPDKNKVITVKKE